MKILLAGAILSPHIRTVANALRVMGLSDEKHFPNFVKCVPRGLRWLSFMVLTEAAFAKKVWALPSLTVLCPSERYDEQRWHPASETDGSRSPSDFVNQAVAAAIGFGICRR